MKNTSNKPPSRWKTSFIPGLNKYIFLLVCLAYLVLSFLAITKPTFLPSLSIGAFSLFLAAFYSDFVSKRLLKLLRSHMTIPTKKDENVYLFAVAVIFTIIFVTVCYNTIGRWDVPFISDDNVGNILTWLSIVWFVFDKCYGSFSES